jgi:spermidine/putrescine transport system permease protein
VADSAIYAATVMPEIVVGVSLLVFFVASGLALGITTIIIAHVAFTISFVTIVVRARLSGMDRSLEEAAQDLGASPVETFVRVTLPLILPGVMAGALLAFTLSFDDFVITFFVSGVGSSTLPLKIYSMIKFGVSPVINALSTMILAGTVILIFGGSRIFVRRENA